MVWVVRRPVLVDSEAVPVNPNRIPALNTPVEQPHTSDNPDRVGTGPARSRILGYIRLGPGDSADQLDRLRQRLADYAHTEDLALLGVFSDVEASATSGFAALIDAIFRTHADTVVLPATHQFARLPGLHLAMKDLLERQTGATVIILETGDDCAIHPDSATGSSRR